MVIYLLDLLSLQTQREIMADGSNHQDSCQDSLDGILLRCKSSPKAVSPQRKAVDNSVALYYRLY